MSTSGRRISTDDATRLVNEYKKTKKPLLEDGLAKNPETTSVWFDYNFCTELMEELQKEQVNGLRIYFGAYDGGAPDEVNKNKMTVVLVSTVGARTQDWGDDNLSGDGSALDAFNDGRLCPPRCNGATL
ncbi:MAG: hypothetical protein V4676_11670 [Bacteroidota bacterium]